MASQRSLRGQRLWATLFAALIITGPIDPQQAAALTTAEIVAKTKPAVVTIRTINTATGDTSSGTGWFYGPRTVMTNAHMLRGTYDQIVVTSVYDNRIYKVDHVSYADPSADAVVFVTAEDSDYYLTPAKTPPVEGDPVVVIGNPKSYTGTVVTGIVAALRPNLSPVYDRPVMQISAPLSHGSSGSPVLDTNGNVIGMIWGGDDHVDAHQIVWAVAYDSIIGVITWADPQHDSGGPLALADKPTAPVVQPTPTPHTEVVSNKRVPRPTQFGRVRTINGETYTTVLPTDPAWRWIASPLLGYLHDSPLIQGSARDVITHYFMDKIIWYWEQKNVTLEDLIADETTYFKKWPYRSNSFDSATARVERVESKSGRYNVTIKIDWYASNGKSTRSGQSIITAWVDLGHPIADPGQETYAISAIIGRTL
jgi:hypothetical protein